MKQTRAYLERVVNESVWRDEDGFPIIEPKNKTMHQGCIYCLTSEIIETSEGPDSIRSIDLMVFDGYLHTICECGTETRVKIRFCPMCGREL